MKEFVKIMADAFKALGDVTRLKIIRILASNKEDEFCVLDIAKKIGITQSAISQHLKVLKHVGIVDYQRKGYRVYYTVNTDMMHEYKENFDELFKKAFIQCGKNVSCSECEEKTECG